MSSTLNTKGKNVDNSTQTQLKAGITELLCHTKEVKSMQKQSTCKNGAVLKSLDEKSSEIKVGGQEMTTRF